MTRTRNRFLTLIAILFSPVAANADLIQITATSSSNGDLGWFIVDDAIFATDTSLQASQFFDFDFQDPLSSVALNAGNVTADTGLTYFGFVAGVWTVAGGLDESLTDPALGTAVVLARSDTLWFKDGTAGNVYADVSWSTMAYSVPEPSSVPEPGTLALFGIGLAGMAIARRRKGTA